MLLQWFGGHGVLTQQGCLCGVGLLVESSDELCFSPRSESLSAERGPGLLLHEVASRPLSRLRVCGPQPHRRARRLVDGTGSRALSERRPLQRMLGIWGLWLYGGAMLSVRKRWLFHASHPHLPIHALFSVPSVLVYNTREAPCSSLGRPKWPEPAEDTSGASGC